METKEVQNDESKWRDLHGGMVSKMRIEKLHEALMRREKDLLQAAVAEAYQAGLNPKHEYLRQAELELEVINIKDELKAAIVARNPDEIRNVILKITNNKAYYSRLQQDVTEAYREIGQIERVIRLGSSIMDMDRKTIGEMRSYHHPPKLIHQVMKAVLLLFKEDEEKTERWPFCQQYLHPSGPQGMNKKILEFEPNSIHPEIAARVDQLLREIELRKLQEVSPGAVTFYIWAKGVVDVVLQNDHSHPPADVKRQKEIFSPTPPSPGRRRKLAPYPGPMSPRKYPPY